MTELSYARNYLEECQGWQKAINSEPTLAGKNIAIQTAFHTLKGRTFHNAHKRNVIVQGDTALQIPDGTSSVEERIYPVIRYGKVLTEGWLGRLYCVNMKEPILTWPIYAPRVLGPVDEEFITPEIDDADAEQLLFRLPIDRPLSRPLHFPVSLIDFAICHDAPYRPHIEPAPTD